MCASTRTTRHRSSTHGPSEDNRGARHLCLPLSVPFFNTLPTDLSTWAKPYPRPADLRLPTGTSEWLSYDSTILIGEPHPRRPVTRRLVRCVHVYVCTCSAYK